MMPLIVKDFTWRQTVDTVVVSLKVNGIRASKSSFITAHNYIRLHCHPHYFEAFLWGEVDDLRGKCTLVEEESLVVFELPKVHVIDWPSLQVDLTTLSRPDKHDIRTRAVELSQKRAADEIAAGLERREANKQMTIREQLRIDEEARERIASIRSFHMESAMNDFGLGKEKSHQGEKLENSIMADRDSNSLLPKSQVRQGPTGEKWNPGDLNRISGPGNSSCWSGRNSSGKGDSKQNDGDGKPIWTKSEIKGTGNPMPDVTKPNVTKTNLTKPDVKKPIPTAPPPIRTQATINVSFTPREFPTPSRESTALEEEQWLKKQAEARKTCGFVDEDLRPEERDPEWLYDKGESLMRAGSFVGAVSAFSTGIKLAPKMGQLYAGRARAHLALQNIRKAVEDASEGLEQLMPRVAQNAKQRLQCHRVRAEAFRSLKMNQDALTDLREALKLDPENIELKTLVQEVSRAADEDYFRDSSEDEENQK